MGELTAAGRDRRETTMSEELPRTTNRPMRFENGTAIGISNRWERGQYCSILTRTAMQGNEHDVAHFRQVLI